MATTRMSLSGWMCCCHLALDVSVFVIMNCEIECEMWNACFLHSHLICFAITNKISQKKRLSRKQEKKLYEKIKNHPIHELTEISVYLVRCSHIFRVLFKRIMMCDFVIHSNHFSFHVECFLWIFFPSSSTSYKKSLNYFGAKVTCTEGVHPDWWSWTKVNCCAKSTR